MVSPSYQGRLKWALVSGPATQPLYSGISMPVYSPRPNFWAYSWRVLMPVRRPTS